jgi:hypothetical protein
MMNEIQKPVRRLDVTLSSSKPARLLIQAGADEHGIKDEQFFDRLRMTSLDALTSYEFFCFCLRLVACSLWLLQKPPLPCVGISIKLLCYCGEVLWSRDK